MYEHSPTSSVHLDDKADFLDKIREVGTAISHPGACVATLAPTAPRTERGRTILTSIIRRTGRFEDDDFAEVLDAELLRSLRAWAEQNANETLRPTGKNLRNLNPILVSRNAAPALELGWWGYLIDGEPAKFPSINTRSERLLQRPTALRGRAIVPVTRWFEMQKPSRTWYSFGEANPALLGLAAVTQPGRTSDGASFTCYSIIMQPAAAPVSAVHDRMPVLIPAEFAPEWLGSAVRPGDLLGAVMNESVALSERLLAEAM